MTANESRPGWGTRAATSRCAGDTLSVAAGADNRAQRLAPDYLEQVTLRAVVDALAQATAGYWRHRADVLEAARPCRGDFHGQASRESLRARYDRLTADALECRRHATLFDHHAVDADLVADVLGWGCA